MLHILPIRERKPYSDDTHLRGPVTAHSTVIVLYWDYADLSNSYAEVKHTLLPQKDEEEGKNKHQNTHKRYKRRNTTFHLYTMYT